MFKLKHSYGSSGEIDVWISQHLRILNVDVGDDSNTHII